MSPRFRCWSYHWVKAGERTVVQFTGKELRLDEEGARALADELIGLGQREVCLDFRHVEFVGSSTLALIVRLRDRLLQADQRLCLYPLPPHVAEIFVATRLDSLFDVCASEEDARCSE